MKIKIFWHILMVNSWYTVVSEQMRILLTSGLYDACEEINIGAIDPENEISMLEDFFLAMYPKLNLRYLSTDPKEYEFPTLRLIEKDRSDYIGLYFHAKGVTKPCDTMVNHWREYLNEMVVQRWSEHVARIKDGYDVSSVNFLRAPDHFSGNFWWFHSRYIDILPGIDSLELHNRYHAEQWVCMGSGMWFYPPFQEPGEKGFLIKYK